MCILVVRVNNVYETCVFRYVPVCMCVLVSEVKYISYGRSRTKSLKTPALLTLLAVSLPPHLRGDQSLLSPLVPAQHGSGPPAPWRGLCLRPEFQRCLHPQASQTHSSSLADAPAHKPLPFGFL